MTDEILTEMNAAYKAARDDEKLSSAVCLFLEPETQEAYSEFTAYRQHSGTDQLKPVRYLDNPVKRRFFDSMLI